jgi:hypothetical protein
MAHRLLLGDELPACPVHDRVPHADEPGYPAFRPRDRLTPQEIVLQAAQPRIVALACNGLFRLVQAGSYDVGRQSGYSDDATVEQSSAEPKARGGVPADFPFHVLLEIVQRMVELEPVRMCLEQVGGHVACAGDQVIGYQDPGFPAQSRIRSPPAYSVTHRIKIIQQRVAEIDYRTYPEAKLIIQPAVIGHIGSTSL